MKFLSYLNEEYVALATGRRLGIDLYGKIVPEDGSWAYEIYVNPTTKEIKHASSGLYAGTLRYIIDFKKKDLYVFNSNLLHYLALPVLKKEGLLPGREGIPPYVTMGSAKVENGKLKFRGSDVGYAVRTRYFEWMDSDDSWLNKWFSEPFIETYMKVLDIERI